jgi:hypothetical protein
MVSYYSHNTRLRYFRIAGITLQIGSAIPMRGDTFSEKFKPFEVDEPGGDTITIEHRFSIPDLNGHEMGKEVYRGEPWTIYKKGQVWLYLNSSYDMLWIPMRSFSRMWHRLHYFRRKAPHDDRGKQGYHGAPEKEARIHQLALCSYDHRRLKIFNGGEELFRRGNLTSLTLFPTDQILLARVLAQRQGCFFHAGGVALEGRVFLFVGHSGAGKTTIVNMMRPMAEVLCDDRMIVRRWPEGFRAHGNWSHGDIEEVSPNGAPLKAAFFLNKARENRIVRLADRKEIVGKLLACLVRPLVTSDWWDNMLALVEDIALEVPCYSLYFDTSGDVVPLLRQLQTPDWGAA